MDDSKKLWKHVEESRYSSPPNGGLNRREFLSASAASLAMLALGGCSRLPLEKVIPYIETPEGVIPGKSQMFATGWSLGGQAHGLLVTSQLGHPTKVDGNPLHPANLGKASSLEQTLLYSLYDKNRLRGPRLNGKNSSWERFTEELSSRQTEMRKTQGRGSVILTEISCSPTLRAQFADLRSHFPHMEWIQFEPLSLERSHRAAFNVSGKHLAPVARLDQAATIIALDADIFGNPLYPLRYTSDFFNGRDSELNRKLFVAEPTPTITGCWTSRRLSVRASRIPALCQALYDHLIKKTEVSLSADEDQWLRAAAQAVTQDPKHAAFFVGNHQPTWVHALVHLLNVSFAEGAVEYRRHAGEESDLDDLRKLVARLEGNEIKSLFIIGGNPALQAPADLLFKAAIAKAKHTYRFSLAEDETSAVSEWHLPLAHPFESWSDSEAFDGTWSVHQPLLMPLFGGKNQHEILSLIQGSAKSSHDLVHEYWVSHLRNGSSWEECIQKGILQKPRQTVKFRPKRKIAPQMSFPVQLKEDEVEIILRGDPHLWDGRFAGNAWLQELPKPITQLTWGNAVVVSPALAQKRKIAMGQVINIVTEHGSLLAPAYILPGQEENTLTLHFGHGSQQGKALGEVGFNAFQIWNSEQPDHMPGRIEVTAQKIALACTQTHHTMEAENPIRRVKDSREQIPSSVEKASFFPQDPIPPKTAAAAAWAMVIDLNRCIGCNACISACQSENNIPVVGRAAVLNGREMHWIRLDRYFAGSTDRPRVFFQPVPCMQCEKAPCEEVCPVAATTHSTDGLNQMVYNRCVGTRYCANNCPYKVRRFNYFSFTADKGELHKFLQNPEVSVRPRGVMEKCTYCVQRLDAARIETQSMNHPRKDGDVRTACQVTCPSEAISFGDKNDLASKVHALRNGPRHYVLLEELGTRPRTTYLAKVDDGD